MPNFDFIKELRAAGLVSKKLTERVVLGTEGGPAPINPAIGQTDANISGHSTAEKPLADQQPAEAPPAAPAPGKTQKEYLINAAKAAMSTAEACNLIRPLQLRCRRCMAS